MLSRYISNRLFWLACALCLFAHELAAQTVGAPPAKPSGNFRIAGTVVSKADGHALARARITVGDVKDSHNVQSMVTAEDGKFEFTGLAAGKYALTGAKLGFISASYDQHDEFSTAIVTGAGLDTESLRLKLAPDAVIAGKILDESGEPVRHATVTLYVNDHTSGVDRIRQSRSTQTDDLGEYEMTPLRPGTYFLSASAQPWYAVHPRTEEAQSRTDSQTRTPTVVDPALDVTYPVTYYPDVAAADEALAIPIQGGERIEADIHFTPAPALRVLVHVPDAGEHHYLFPILEQAAFDGSTPVRTDSVRQISPGLMEFTGVPAGRYDIRFSGQGPSVKLNGVDLTKDGEEIDASKSGTVSSVRFTVQIPGQSMPAHLNIGLRSGDRMINASQEIDSKGEAELQQVAAGKYEVAVFARDARYSIARISSEGAEVSGHSLNISVGSSPTVSLTLVGGKTEVEGKVTQAGKGFAGAMVVLVPKDPELDHDLFRRDQSDLDGTFVLHNVVPGSYTLLAIENGWDLDWSQPGVIGAYTKHRRKIQVGDVSGHPMNVADTIEVQEK